VCRALTFLPLGDQLRTLVLPPNSLIYHNSHTNSLLTKSSLQKPTRSACLRTRLSPIIPIQCESPFDPVSHHQHHLRTHHPTYQQPTARVSTLLFRVNAVASSFLSSISPCFPSKRVLASLHHSVFSEIEHCATSYSASHFTRAQIHSQYLLRPAIAHKEGTLPDQPTHCGSEHDKNVK